MSIFVSHRFLTGVEWGQWDGIHVSIAEIRHKLVAATKLKFSPSSLAFLDDD